MCTLLFARVGSKTMNTNNAMPPDITKAAAHTQLFFLKLLEAGESPSIAEILSLRQFPSCKTDESFLQGRLHDSGLGDQIPTTRDFMLERAKDAGVDISGKVYVSGLAQSAGDPNAWVSDRSEAKAKAASLGREVRNLNTETIKTTYKPRRKK